MAESLRLFVLAGEASGDRIGADLVRRLRTRTGVEATGVGGADLAAEGLQSLFPMSDLSVMGWSDVLVRLPLLLWRARQVADAIIRGRPDVVVLIDSQVFTRVVAERVRKAGSKVPMLLYVAPAVWVWAPERAAKLTPLFDEVLAVLPFEPGVMAELRGPSTSYVGHPALTGQAMRQAQPDRGAFLLLPGSRTGELRRHLRLMQTAVEALRGHPRVSGFVLPTLAHLRDRLVAEVASWSTPVEVVTGAARDTAFSEAVGAFAVSGTVTLELAMAGVPMVVTYVGDRGQAKRYAKLEKPPMVGLPNIVAGREVVPELLFPGEIDFARVAPMLRSLLDDDVAIAKQLAAFREVRALMQEGAPEAPLVDPAERVLALAAQPRPLIGS
ncbi:MAG: lipid-A-disaccharide synthase [Devosia sp.]|nr:lipid-A-disaccharide synthase [Devosia sp.]